MSSELKLDEGLCRCCHAQGMFQNLSTPFVCQGQEEIYSEMLRECFNVIITPLEGEYSTSTYTICITCALKLRDANEFRKQILECEERFKEVCKEVMKSLEPMDIDIKLEIDVTEDQSIKEEPSYDDMDTRAEDDYEVKSEGPKEELNKTIKRTPTDDNKGKGRKLRVTSAKGKPAVKVKRQNRIGMPRRQKKNSGDSTTNETDSTKNKAATVTGTRKKIADKKTLVDKSYKKDEKSPPAKIEVERPEHDDTAKDLKCSIKREVLSNKTFHKRKFKSSTNRRRLAVGISNEDILNQIIRMDDDGGVQYMCVKCEKVFGANEQCVNHVKKHFRVKLSCPLCEMKLVNQNGKTDHLARRHGKKEVKTEQGTVLIDLSAKYKCDFCDKKFSSRNAARKHVRFHEEKLCRPCGVMFDTPREVICHMEDVHGKYVPTCGICDYKCLQESKVVSHQRKVHMREKNVKCELCDSQFFSAKDMRKHMVKHNPEKKFECEFCHKRYPRLNTLNEHRKIHKGVKNKVCEICSERFVQKASLNYHMTKRHPDAKF